MAVNGIEVTDVIVFKIKKGNRVASKNAVARARVVLNDVLIISEIEVIVSSNGPWFVKFPQARNNGLDAAFPITAEFRTYLSDQILAQYSLTMCCAEGEDED